MHEGDATKSAITDGMKKCASRLDVGSDSYKGLVTWDKQEKQIKIPDHYISFYQNNDFNFSTPAPSIYDKQQPTSNNTKKSALTEKLKNQPSSTYKQMQAVWRQLVGGLDDFDEWVNKKTSEQIAEEQMLHMLQKKISEKKFREAHE